MDINDNEDDSALKPFQCKYCPKSFVHEKSIQHHILNQHGKDKLKIKPLHCSQCLKTNQVTKYFAKRHLLNSHIREAHSRGRFQCDICLKTFTFPSKFKTHRLIHSTDIDKKFECDLCSSVFSAQKTLNYHLFYKHGRKLEGGNYLTCDLCPQEFLGRFYLERHVLAKHVVDKDFECDVCSKRFIDQKSLDKHVKGHDSPTNYFCDVCSKGFKCSQSLCVHLGVEHNKFFHCSKCCRSFTNKPEFDQHFQSRTGSDLKSKFKCPSCSKVLPSQCTFTIHTNSHPKPFIKTVKKTEAPMENRIEADLPDTEKEAKGPNPEIKCGLCSKIFDRESYFAIHRKQVHPNADWPCDFEQCTKSFKKYYKLILHKTTHSGSKPFVCPTCQKSFNLRKKLKRHQITHLNEKPFDCAMCPKTFVSRVAQRIHIANKHGGSKPFKCPVINCGMSFASKAYLNTHLISHETVTSFKCDICTDPKEFKGRAHLNQHLRVVHSIGNIGKSQISESKYADAVVFTCNSKDCSFKTASEKEVAVHYNEKHRLPKVVLFQNIKMKVENNILGSASMPLFSREIRKLKTNRMIVKRYKCKFCPKLLTLRYFKSHQETCTVKASFKCSHCFKLFRYKATLNKHMSQKHYRTNYKSISKKN